MSAFLRNAMPNSIRKQRNEMATPIKRNINAPDKSFNLSWSTLAAFLVSRWVHLSMFVMYLP